MTDTDTSPSAVRIIQKRIGSTPFPGDLQGIVDDVSLMIASLEARAEKAEAERDTAWNDAIEAARLPRPECASTWTLDPKFVMQVTHEINRIGWDTCMEVVELAMLAAERALAEGDSHE